MRTASIWLLALLISGCLSADGQDEPLATTDDLAGEAQPLAVPVNHYMHDCRQAVLIFHVPLERLQAALPAGYTAMPAEAQYAQLTPLPRPPVAPTGDGWLFVEAHGCAPHDGAEPHVDVNVQIAIEASKRDEGRPFATVLAYEVARASAGGPFLETMQAMGVEPFGDEVEYEWSDEGSYRTASVTVRANGVEVLSFDMPLVAENPIPIDDAYGRVWAETPTGTLTFGWDAGDATGEPVNAYLGGVPPSCSVAPGSVVAGLIGSTTCEGARAQGILTVPLMPELHDMNITWQRAPAGAPAD